VTTDNWVTIAGFTTAGSLVAIGWFVTGHLNRAKEVVLKRLEYRLKALHDCLPILFANRSSILTTWIRSSSLRTWRSKFQLYGFADEIDGMERFHCSV